MMMSLEPSYSSEESESELNYMMSPDPPYPPYPSDHSYPSDPSDESELNFVEYLFDSNHGIEISKGRAFLAYLRLKVNSADDANEWIVMQCVIELQSKLGHGLLDDTISILDNLVSQINNITSKKFVFNQKITADEEALLEKTDQIFSEIFLKFVKLLKPEVFNYLTVPEMQQSFGKDRSSPNANELLASFINFILEILDRAVNVNSDHKQRYDVFYKELTFLFTILGDVPFKFTQLAHVKTLLLEFKKIAIEVGNLIYSSHFEKVTHNLFDEKRDTVLENVALLKENIKQHCIKFSEPFKCVFPSSIPIDSLFIVESLLEDLENLMDRQLEFIIDDDIFDQIKTLQEELKSSRSLIKNIKVPQDTHIVSLVQIKDVAFEAQYLINSHVVGNVPVWYLKLRLPSVIRKIELINYFSMTYNGTKATNDFSTRLLSHNVVSPPVLVDDLVVGFEGNRTEILGYLIGGLKDLQIIAIVGMPGLGKTATTKKLYHDRSICEHFDRRVWCVVSQTYERRRLLVDILTSLTNISSDDEILKNEDHTLGSEIHKSLIGRRYLIVIDDVWQSNTFDDMSIYFPDDVNGSRIMLTSQIIDVVPANGIIHSFPLLSEIQSWELLQNKVFPNEPCPRELVEIGKALAVICKGLPLAIVVTAGVLKNFEKKESAWEKVKEQLDAYLLDDVNGYKKILELSYKNLHDNLKLCFLYLGVFPEDSEIPIKKVKAVWIAEGFIQKKENMSQEDVAEEYLFDLINRSLLLVTRKRSDGGIKTCGIHDLLRDMCVRKATEENFMKYVQKDNISSFDEHKRLCFCSTPPIWRYYGLHCRTLVGCHLESSYNFSRMKLLRVMDSPVIMRPGYSPVKKIEVPTYLTFLFLSRMPNLEQGSFVNLEYLHIEDYGIRMPLTISKMVKLKHLHVKDRFYFEEDCDITQTNNLRYISCVEIRSSKDVEILKCSPHLQRLKLVCFEGTMIAYNDLSSFTELESLTMVVYNDRLTLHNLPLTIKRLNLSFMDFSGEMMSIIGRLPNLYGLKLEDCQFMEQKWETTEGEFQELRFLRLSGVPLRYWTTYSDHFPELQRLVIDHCRHLEKVPRDFGEHTTLETIEMIYCTLEINESADLIEKDQHEFGNEKFKVTYRN